VRVSEIALVIGQVVLALHSFVALPSQLQASNSQTGTRMRGKRVFVLNLVSNIRILASHV